MGLLSGLNSYWKFNDNTSSITVVDSLGINNGTAQRNTNILSTTGIINYALSYNASIPDYVSLPENGYPTGSYTVSAWAKVNDLSANYTVWDNNNFDSHMAINSGGTVNFQIYEVGGQGHNISSIFAITAGTWHLLTMTYDGTNLGLYVDITQLNTTNSNAANFPITVPNGRPLSGYTGKSFGRTLGSPHSYMNGVIDECGIWNRAISLAEVIQLYNNGQGITFPFTGAQRDKNRIPVLLGTLNTDGKTPVPIYIDQTLHCINISDGTTGSGTTTTNIQKDQNRVPTIWGVSSADGITPIAIWTDGNGNLLTKSS